MTFSTASQIDALLEEATQEPYNNLPRIVVMAANRDGVLYSGASGYTSIIEPFSSEWKSQLQGLDKVTDESIFDIYSCTKLPAVISILQLLEKGLLKMSDDASQWVKELKDVQILRGWNDDGPVLEKNDKAITVEMLVDHTAGFTYGSPDAFLKYLQTNSLIWPYGDGFSREALAKLPLIRAPGEGFQYGLNNDWLGLVVEEISGLSLEDYFQKNIFKPLGITDMSFKANPLKMTMAYEGATPEDPYTFTKGKVFAQKQDFGGAGLSGSPKSYLVLTRAILNGGFLPEKDNSTILKKETVDLMFTPHFTEAQKKNLYDSYSHATDPFSKASKVPIMHDWGYGGFLSGADYPSGRKMGSLAWSGVANSFWICDRKSGLTFVIWTNIFPKGSAQRVKWIFDLWEKVEPLLYQGAAGK